MSEFNPYSDDDMTKLFTKIVRKYLNKNKAFIQAAWEDQIRRNVYQNTPLVYIRTEALLNGFNVNKFINSFSIRVDQSGFNVDLDYKFDTAGGSRASSPVADAHARARGTKDINSIMVDVTYPHGQVQESLPMFMRTHRRRSRAGGTPALMSSEVLRDKLHGSFRLPKNKNDSYFAAYFLAGANAPNNPEVYKRGGANPKGVQTERNTPKYHVILDFLLQIGLIADSKSKPSGGKTDWIITIKSFTPTLGLNPAPMQCAIGGLLAACTRVYGLLQRGWKGKSILHTRNYKYQGNNKAITRLSDAVQQTRLFRRWQDAFWGSRHAGEIQDVKARIAARLQEHTGAITEDEADAAIAEIRAIESKGLVEGLSGLALADELESFMSPKTKETLATMLIAKETGQGSSSYHMSPEEASAAGFSDAVPAGENDEAGFGSNINRKEDEGFLAMDPEDRIQDAWVRAFENGGKVILRNAQSIAELESAVGSFAELAESLKLERRDDCLIVTVNM